ncbi:hypothetical protein C8A03DRAFT_31679 [Achaetomium macrosporum]|uniref:C2H2-type domain-containing protein n=1 Tax=Achaetomium macrosporum TaxID=79813 RepID=A0AAN7CDT3_9PEZI|nr:hypothetical protein C8A03DRAFT_31679 [Achaetomium macrosporum]
MASLSFIMDVTDDHHPVDGRHPLDKRDRGASKPASAGPLRDSPSNPQADPRHASSPGLPTAEKDINQTAPAGQSKRRRAPSRRSRPAAALSGPEKTEAETEAALTVLSSSSSSPPVPAATARQSTRRRKTSDDSMDRTRYGPAGPSSSTGGGLQRPMSLHPTATAQFATRITPKTGRVSKAKKGLPVHVCNICRPPKTFTRAEHLRRHQLGHGEPQFQCPGCERAFHRPDLLARHQQKHEHEGDEVSKSGSTQQSPRPSPRAHSFQPQRSPRTPGSVLAVSPSSTDITATPNAAAGNKPGFSQIENSANGSSSVYRPPHGSSRDYTNAYALSPTISVVNPAQSSSLTGSYQSSLENYQPRTGPPPIYVITQGLQTPSVQPTELPDLHDASPWPSSASDSTYSTSASDISKNPRPWTRGHRSPTADWTTSQRLSPYPSAAPRALQSSGTGVGAIPALHSPLFIDSYAHSQPSEHPFGGILNVATSISFSASGTTGHHHPPLSASTDSTVRPHHHQHSSSISSVRNRSSPLDSSPHSTETLVAAASAAPSSLNAMLSLDRQKGVVMEGPMGSQAAIGSLGVLDGLAIGYGAGGSNAASPGADNASHSSGIVAELDLAMGGACAMATRSSITIPLPGPVRAAIPRYLEIYWAQIDPVLPLVHRQLFEAAPEDVLRCAMAAVATQQLNSREDRNRGNQLHEFAWQEVKRMAQWSLQTMQAILLCEYFARFRGRKAVTRPSKPFESLYSRALYQNPAPWDDAVLAANERNRSIQERWHHWIDAESRRRLFVACLFADGHAAIYHQQRRAEDSEAEAYAALEPIPLFGRGATLWRASSAEEWASALSADPGALEHPEHVPALEHLSAEDIERRPPIDRMVILSVLALRLPRRQRPPPAAALSANNSPAPEMDPHTQHVGEQFSPGQRPSFLRSHQIESQCETFYHFEAEERMSTLFPNCPVANTYLALHHTPLRDLLAVSGDSWVFSQKILPATSFHEHQKRVKTWVTSSATSGSSLAGLSVARATVYAARAILGFLNRRETVNPAAPWSTDISDYWALYVCALICWAFGHRAHVEPQHNHDQHQHQHFSRRRSGSCAGGRSSATIGTAVTSAGSSPVPTPAASSSSRPASVMSVSAAAAAAGDDEAFAWLSMVAAEGVRLEEVIRMRGRREAVGVVGLVRRRLESDCLGGRSRLYVDAVGVLRKLEEGVGWRWF